MKIEVLRNQESQNVDIERLTSKKAVRIEGKRK